MNSTKRILLLGALCSAVAVVLLAGCGKKSDPVDAAAQADKKAGIAAPSIAETKAIAEEAFIYGLPLVMNYAVMYEFVVDKNSGQFKAPFNQSTTSPRLHLRGHGRHHAEQRHALLDGLARPARGADGDLGAGGAKKRYYSVQLIDGNTYNYGYIGSRATGSDAGRLSGRRSRLEGRDAPGHQEGLSLDHAVRAGRLSAPSCSTPRTCRTS